MYFIYPNYSEFNSGSLSNCSILTTSSNGLLKWFNLLVISISMTGFISDTICVSIFFRLKKRRIFKTLGIFCCFSLCNNLMDSSTAVVFLSLNDRILHYKNEAYFDNKYFAYYFSYCYMYIFSILYSSSGAYSIYIIYERILIFRSTWPFKNTTTKRILIGE